MSLALRDVTPEPSLRLVFFECKKKSPRVFQRSGCIFVDGTKYDTVRTEGLREVCSLLPSPLLQSGREARDFSCASNRDGKKAKPGGILRFARTCYHVSQLLRVFRVLHALCMQHNWITSGGASRFDIAILRLRLSLCSRRQRDLLTMSIVRARDSLLHSAKCPFSPPFLALICDAAHRSCKLKSRSLQI